MRRKSLVPCEITQISLDVPARKPLFLACDILPGVAMQRAKAPLAEPAGLKGKSDPVLQSC
jgi:hypothetical protein